MLTAVGAVVVADRGVFVGVPGVVRAVDDHGVRIDYAGTVAYYSPRSLYLVGRR